MNKTNKNNNMTKRGTWGTAVLLLLLMGSLAVVGVSAYFTDREEVVNHFTVGKISLQLTEPGWDESNGKNILPEQEISKDPQITNDGNNEEYVFIEVIVPYVNVVTESDDGTAKTTADTELFAYDINDGWIEVGSEIKDETNKTVTHVYAYGTSSKMTTLAAGATTVSLFDYVRLVNVGADQDLEESDLSLEICAYGIQTTNLHDGDTTIDGENADGKTAPTDVWQVISAHKPTA